MDTLKHKFNTPIRKPWTYATLKYSCPYCHFPQGITYKDYETALNNVAYCDECITRKTQCITPNWQMLITNLPNKNK